MKARIGARQAAGFTLLEIVVVLAIFAIMATMAYGGLASVLRTRDRLQTAFLRTQEFQRAYWVMRDDLYNGVYRPAQIDTDVEPALFVTSTTETDIEFTRLGWSNPMDLRRSTLERVGYSLDGTNLIRRQWPVVDRTSHTQPNDATLLQGVNAVNWRFMDAKMQWQDQWPPQSVQVNPQQLPPPRAVEVRLETADWGEIILEFAFGVVAPVSDQT